MRCFLYPKFSLRKTDFKMLITFKILSFGPKVDYHRIENLITYLMVPKFFKLDKNWRSYCKNEILILKILKIFENFYSKMPITFKILSFGPIVDYQKIENLISYRTVPNFLNLDKNWRSYSKNKIDRKKNFENFWKFLQ